MTKEQEDEKKLTFGGYAIIDGVTHHFRKLPDTYWIIRPITSGIELERSKFLLHNRVVETPDGIRYDQPPTYLEICYREIALTFGGTNLCFEGNSPALEDGAHVMQVEATLRKMPHEMVLELWDEIGKLYPTWGPADPNVI